MNEHAHTLEIGNIVITTKVYKTFLIGTKGWIYREEMKDGAVVFVAIFFAPNFSGSNRHNVTIFPKDYSKIKVIGSSISCPTF